MSFQIKGINKDLENSGFKKNKNDLEEAMKLERLHRKLDLMHTRMEMRYLKQLEREWDSELKELREKQNYYG